MVAEISDQEVERKAMVTNNTEMQFVMLLAAARRWSR